MEDKMTFTTKIDKCGRFVIPAKIIKTLSWDKGIVALGEVVDNTVVIRSLGNQMNCSKCNKQYSSQYSYCPICGNKLEQVKHEE